VSSLTLDSSRQLLYFTDPGTGSVNVLTTDAYNSSSHVLISGTGDTPTAISVDSMNRFFAHHDYNIINVKTTWRNNGSSLFVLLLNLICQKPPFMTQCKGHHGYKTAEITLLCHKVLCFRTLLASPAYKKGHSTL